MVKLKLAAIKQATPPSTTSPQATAPLPQKTASAPVKAPVAAVVSRPENKVTPSVQASTQPAPAKPAPVKQKMTLGGIKRIDPAKVAAAAAKKAMPTKQKLEIFPIGANCELKNIELFPAYTSKFKKKQGSLLQEIKKLKRLPKTNKFFILTLVGATIAGISMLFLLAPEKHNLNHYKTSLIESYEQFNAPKPVEVFPDPIVVIDEQDTDWEDSDDEDETPDENNIDPTTPKDVQYYRGVKKQILGDQFVGETALWEEDNQVEEIVIEPEEDSTADDTDIVENQEIDNADATPDEEIFQGWLSWENNFEDFEDSAQGWPDDIID